MPDWSQEIRKVLVTARLEPAREAEIVDELTQHLQDRYEELLLGGSTKADAQRTTLAELCDTDALVRELRRVSLPADDHAPVMGSNRNRNVLTDLWQDLRYAVRLLKRNPTFSAMVVVTLALGIGANTAVFSLIDTFLFQVLPVSNPQQLVFVQTVHPNGRTTSSFPHSTFEQLRDRNHSFSGMFVWDDTPIDITIDDQPEIARGDFVSGSYFDVLGVSALRGRTFTLTDDQPGKDPVAVISYSYWERRFGRDPRVVGKTILVGGLPFSVIGVTPSNFFGREVSGRPADFVLPMFMQGQLALRDHNTFQVMARLRPEVSLEQANSDLDLIYQQLSTQSAIDRTGSGRPEVTIPSVKLKPALRGNSQPDFASELPILLSVVAIVLLIACVNVGNLLLARSESRRKEIALRLSLGASRYRLIRQLLAESVLLALLGGIFGLIVSRWGASVLLFIVSAERESMALPLRPNLRVLAFTTGVSLLTGITFGLIPSLMATRVDLNSVLKGSESQTRNRPAHHRLVRSLVVAQLALSLALLVAAGLLIRTLQQLHVVNTGFEREKVLTMWAYPALIGYDHAREVQLYGQLIDRLNSLPGVHSASLSRYSIITGGKGGNIVGPHFFETMGIPMVQGRDFTATDTANSSKVAIISERLAWRLYPNNSVVGQLLPDDLSRRPGRQIQVVGVVKDVRHRLRQAEGDEEVYLPYTQVPPERLGQIKIFLRASENPKPLIPAVRNEVQAIEKNLALRDIQTVDEEMNSFIGGERSLATLLSFFGALALTLAAIGLYGALSYTVGRRTKELGIRMALGAQTNSVLWMIVREALWQVMIGVLIGIPLALATTRLIANVLYGVQATDAVTISLVVLLMLAVALTAAYLPARRATRVNPMDTLRYE